MKIATAEQARSRLAERKPEFQGSLVYLLWEHAGAGGDSYAFAVDDDSHVSLVWVGPRGGVETSMRYSKKAWGELVRVFGGIP